MTVLMMVSFVYLSQSTVMEGAEICAYLVLSFCIPHVAGRC
jgi:phage shock protein PspC (stress-responsive transcriptional regulator)